MRERCRCSLFSCFSGNNSQSSSSALPPADTNASPAVVIKEAPDLRRHDPPNSLPASISYDASTGVVIREAPDLRRQDPQTPLPASISYDASTAVVIKEAPDLRRQDPQTPLPASISYDASTFAESPSSSAPTQDKPHDAPASDPSSSTSTVSELTKKIKDAAAVDGENDMINLDGLVEDISELLKIIKTKSSDKKPSTERYWPSSPFYSKLREILSEATDGALGLVRIKHQ